MNIDLLNQYNLKFLKIIGSNNNIILGASGGGISEMLDDSLDTYTIDEFLQKINLYANGGTDPEGYNILSTELHTTYLDNKNADIYLTIGDSKYVQTIPLDDLKNILIMWKDFLIQNGH